MSAQKKPPVLRLPPSPPSPKGASPSSQSPFLPGGGAGFSVPPFSLHQGEEGAVTPPASGKTPFPKAPPFTVDPFASDKPSPSLGKASGGLARSAFRLVGLLLILGGALLTLGEIAHGFYALRQQANLPLEEPDRAFLAPVAPSTPEGTAASLAAEGPKGSFSSPQATPIVPPAEPEEIRIPALGLQAPVVPLEAQTFTLQGQTYRQYAPPDWRAVGWPQDSARLGQPGNTLLIGHHNIFGEVFRHLHRLKPGDRIWLVGRNGRRYLYQVTEVRIVQEKNEPLSVRLENARWLAPTGDERITLVTCWPYESNTHRVIVIARPLPSGAPDLPSRP